MESTWDRVGPNRLATAQCEWCGTTFTRETFFGEQPLYCCKPHRRRANNEQQRLKRQDTLIDQTCHYCRREPATTWDHIVPKAEGGTLALWNRVPACARCNGKKADRWPTCPCGQCRLAVALRLLVVEDCLHDQPSPHLTAPISELIG